MSDGSEESSLLTEMAELRRATRASTASWWYPMVLFGVVAVGGGVVSLTNDVLQMAWWVAAVAVALLFTARFYQRRAVSLSVVAKHRRYWVLWLLIAAGAFAAPILAPAGAEAPAAWIVLAVGYLAAAGMGRSVRLAVLAAMLGATSAIVALSSATAFSADVACGCVVFGCGLAARGAVRRR